MGLFGLPGWYGVARAIEYNGGRCRLDGWREFLDFSEDGSDGEFGQAVGGG